MAVARSARIEFDLKRVDVDLRETKTVEYLAINPLGKVPFYAEPGFTLGESAAIMKYLSATNKVADHWYPGSPALSVKLSEKNTYSAPWCTTVSII